MDNYYAVEIWVDGFGDDTWVESIWKTKEEAERYAEERYTEEIYTIVKGRFGEELEQIYG